MASDVTLVRRLGRGSTTEYRARNTDPVKLCVKERRVRTTSIQKSQRDGPGDGTCAWECRTCLLLPRTRSSARIAVYGVAKDSSLGGGKRVMERMHGGALDCTENTCLGSRLIARGDVDI